MKKLLALLLLSPLAFAEEVFLQCIPLPSERGVGGYDYTISAKQFYRFESPTKKNITKVKKFNTAIDASRKVYSINGPFHYFARENSWKGVQFSKIQNNHLKPLNEIEWDLHFLNKTTLIISGYYSQTDSGSEYFSHCVKVSKKTFEDEIETFKSNQETLKKTQKILNQIK